MEAYIIINLLLPLAYYFIALTREQHAHNTSQFQYLGEQHDINALILHHLGP